MSHINEAVLTLAQKEQLQKIILDPNNIPDNVNIHFSSTIENCYPCEQILSADWE